MPSAMSASEREALASSTPSYLAPSEEDVSEEVRRGREKVGAVLPSSVLEGVRCLSVMESEDRETISERIHGSSPEDSYDQTSVPASILND